MSFKTTWHIWRCFVFNYRFGAEDSQD